MSNRMGKGGEGVKKQADAKANRKPYAQPRLVEYGSVAKLTQNNGATTVDGQGPAMGCL